MLGLAGVGSLASRELDTLVEVPMEKLGATAGWPKHESRACALPAAAFPSKEAGAGEAPTCRSG